MHSSNQIRRDTPPGVSLRECVKKADSRLPWRGKRSAVAVVNDSPVDCQSRNGTASRRLSALAD